MISAQAQFSWGAGTRGGTGLRKGVGRWVGVSCVVIPIAAQMFFRRVNRLDRDFFEFFFSFTGQIFAHSYSNFTRLKNIWAAIGIT